MNIRNLFAFVFLLAAPAIFSDEPSGPAATRIFINGDIWTADPEKPRAEAIALHDEKILAVGSNKEVLALQNGKTEVNDLEGKFVTPGFNDAHIHFLVPD